MARRRPTADPFATWRSARSAIHDPTKLECAAQLGEAKLQCVLNGLRTRSANWKRQRAQMEVASRGGGVPGGY